MRILIISQSNEPTEALLNFAVQIAPRAGEPATILTVIEHEAERCQAEETLARSCQILGLENVQTKIRVGHPVWEIIQEAEEGNYNLIVASDRFNHPPVTGFFSNPVVSLLEHAPCPVVIVKDNVRPVRRILLCDSGARSPSELSFFTARLVEMLDSKGEVVVLHVMSQMSAGPGVRGIQLRASGEELIKQQTPEGEILKRNIQILERPGIHPTPKLRHGLVLDEILSEVNSGDYDLVVIGSHQRKGWQRLLLDDLAKKILFKIDKPVLVVKQKLDQADHKRSSSVGSGTN